MTPILCNHAAARSGQCVIGKFVVPPTLPSEAYTVRASADPLPLHHLFYILEYMGKREYLGQLELMVLLAVVRPSSNQVYGVSIARDIARSSGRQVALASVYAALERLEKKGLLASSLGEPTVERGGKARTYFRPTPAGIREARETRATLLRLSGDLPTFKGEPA